MTITPGAGLDDVQERLFTHHRNIERYRSHLKIQAHMHGTSNAVARYGELPEDFAAKFGILIEDIEDPRVRRLLVRAVSG